MIDEIYTAYGKMNRWDLVRVSRELAEWQDPNGSAIPIQYREILRAGNKTESEIATVEAELESLAAAEAMLQPAWYRDRKMNYPRIEAVSNPDLAQVALFYKVFMRSGTEMDCGDTFLMPAPGGAATPSSPSPTHRLTCARSSA